MKIRYSVLLTLLVALSVGLSHASQSVPGCSDERVQALLKQSAQNEYSKRLVIAESAKESERQRIVSDAEYARKAMDKMSISDAIDTGTVQEYVRKLTEYHTLIAHEEIMREYGLGYDATIAKHRSVLKTLGGEKPFSFITTMNTNQSTGAHHCVADLLIRPSKDVPWKVRVAYTVRNTDAGETFVSAFFPKL